LSAQQANASAFSSSFAPAAQASQKHHLPPSAFTLCASAASSFAFASPKYYTARGDSKNGITSSIVQTSSFSSASRASAAAFSPAVPTASIHVCATVLRA